MSAVGVLAIDPGTHSGWACSVCGKSGAFDLVWKGPTDDAHGAFGWQFTRAIDTLFARHLPAVLVIERQMAFSRFQKPQLQLGLRMLALTAAHRHRALTVEVSPATWQAWAKPRGWAKTSDVGDARAIRDWFVAERLEKIAAA